MFRPRKKTIRKAINKALHEVEVRLLPAKKDAIIKRVCIILQIKSKYYISRKGTKRKVERIWNSEYKFIEKYLLKLAIKRGE